MSLYFNDHEYMYAASSSAITRKSGCTWTSASDGVDASTGGISDPTPDRIKALVARDEETNPNTPGWSIPDVDLAMSRLHVPFTDRSGRGWDAVVNAHDAGLYLILQGDSDRFSDANCSGDFDGDHCIGVHPDEDAQGRWRIDDGICRTARYEWPGILKSYATKLSASVRFGTFDQPVPEEDVKIDVVAYGPWTVDIAVGAQLYDLDGKPLIKVSTPQKDRPAPSETIVGGKRYVMVVVTTGGLAQYVLVRPTSTAGRVKVGAPKKYPVTVGGKPAGDVILP